MTKCRHGWFRFRDSEYKIGQERKTFLRSEATCNLLGATLVHIDSKAESNFLKQHLAPCNDNFWIGLFWKDDSLHWTRSNESPKFEDWGNNMPSNELGANCIVATKRKGYKWSNVRCRSVYNYICEK